MKLNFVFLFDLCLVVCCWCSMQCMDESGSPVDWLVMYKLPKTQVKSVTGTGLVSFHQTNNINLFAPPPAVKNIFLILWGPP